MKTARKYRSRARKVLTGILRSAACALLLLCLVVAGCYYTIKWSPAKTYDNVQDVPYRKVGLVLGTSPRLRDGRNNLYFDYRIEAAAALYNSGKISRILVSGDNRRLNYNEPAELRKALIAKGIPDSVIVLDYAGLRTLDSVVRSKKVFGQDSVTIISQRFHNERALFIASVNGIEAIGYNARDVSAKEGFKTQGREYLARVKVFIDLVTRKGPRHLGDPVPIP